MRYTGSHLSSTSGEDLMTYAFVTPKTILWRRHVARWNPSIRISHHKNELSDFLLCRVVCIVQSYFFVFDLTLVREEGNFDIPCVLLYLSLLILRQIKSKFCFGVEYCTPSSLFVCIILCNYASILSFVGPFFNTKCEHICTFMDIYKWRHGKKDTVLAPSFFDR